MAVLNRVSGSRARVKGWRAVVQVLRSSGGQVVDDLVTLMFPADCRCCAGPLLRAGLVPVCESCVGSLRPSDLAACWQCGEAIAPAFDIEDMRFAEQMAASLRCRACRMAQPHFERAVAYGNYTGELRTMIGLLKFDAVAALAKTLGAKLAEATLSLSFPADDEVLVVAVPLAPARQAQRGYNQSVLLAEEALKRLKHLRPEWKLKAAHGCLRRIRMTEAQYVLSLAARRRNLRGAFVVHGDVAGRTILLVDDIMTSGATARECARVFIAAGAARVSVATLARAQKQEFLRTQVPPEQQVARWGAN